MRHTTIREYESTLTNTAPCGHGVDHVTVPAVYISVQTTDAALDLAVEALDRAVGETRAMLRRAKERDAAATA